MMHFLPPPHQYILRAAVWPSAAIVFVPRADATRYILFYFTLPASLQACLPNPTHPAFTTTGLSTRIGFKYQNPWINPLTIFQFARACPVHDTMQASGTFFGCYKGKGPFKIYVPGSI